MRIANILEHANRLGITLSVEGGAIAARPKGATPPDLADAIRANRDALLAHLNGQGDNAGDPAHEPSKLTLPLKPCGQLVCPRCKAMSPAPHRAGCADAAYAPCGSIWFWLSPYRAIKCVSCFPPADLALAEAWVMARGGDHQVPNEILKVLPAVAPAQ